MTFRSKYRDEIGKPKFAVGTHIGKWTIMEYLGHSDVNKRDASIMSKPQHWYNCLCTCGKKERRSQQELNDTRRQQACLTCRSTTPKQ